MKLVLYPRHEGYIYFMQRKSGGAIKIGFTRNLSSRLADLRASTRWPDLIIKCAIWHEDAWGLEHNLHFELRDHRVPNGIDNSREWFADTEEVRGWMPRLASGIHPPQKLKLLKPRPAKKPRVVKIKVPQPLTPWLRDNGRNI